MKLKIEISKLADIASEIPAELSTGMNWFPTLHLFVDFPLQFVTISFFAFCSSAVRSMESRHPDPFLPYSPV